MRTLYYDSEFKCHTTNPDGVYKEFQTGFFDGMCDEVIEGYQFVPAGESWTREDGEVFRGDMIAPWKDFAALDEAQRAYEREMLADAENALAILLGGETA